MPEHRHQDTLTRNPRPIFPTTLSLTSPQCAARKTKEELLKCYVTCTRLDLALNALMIRGRYTLASCEPLLLLLLFKMIRAFIDGRNIKVMKKGGSAPKSKAPKAKAKTGKTAKTAKRPHSGGSSAGASKKRRS